MSNYSFPQGGDPLSRQASHSLYTPTLMDYKDNFRGTSEKGHMKLQLEKNGPWMKKYFLLEDGVLKFADSPFSNEREFRNIYMKDVISFRTDNSASEPTVVVSTAEQKYRLRLATADEMRNWIFCFQKSVALVLTQLLESSTAHSVSSPTAHERNNVWSNEQQTGGHHGQYNNLARRHDGGSGFRAFTTEDVHKNALRNTASDNSTIFNFQRNPQLLPTSPPNYDNYNSIFGQQRIPSQDHGSSELNSSRILAVSPAIPIVPGSLLSEDDHYRERIASSYHDDDEDYSPLSEMINNPGMRNHLTGEYDDHDDDLEDDSQQVEDSLADDMMFDMDDHLDNVKGGSNLSHHHGSHSSSHGNNIVGNVISLSGKHSSGSRRPSLQSTTSRSTPRSSFSSVTGAPLVPSSSSVPTVRWVSGFCSKLGPRTKNEDRFVTIANLHNHHHKPAQAHAQPHSHSNSTNNNNATHNHHPSSSHGHAHDEFHVGSLNSVRSYLSTSSNGTLPRCGFFAVYDGHCGIEASSFLEKELHDRVLQHVLFHENLAEAIHETCVSLDREFLDLCKHKNYYSGTTAVGSFIRGSELVVFNIGDSMAVLCSNGVAKEMSDSHKPGRPDEVERVKQANGWITEEKELYMARLHRMDLSDPVAVREAQNMNWVTIHRICGELAVTRSIGDPDYKRFTPGAKVDAFFSWPDGHDQSFYADLVIPDPECQHHTLSSEDEFLIIASDGLWDVVPSNEAILRVQNAFRNQKSPTEAAEILCDLALRLGSSDNVTVVIVQFLHQ